MCVNMLCVYVCLRMCLWVCVCVRCAENSATRCQRSVDRMCCRVLRAPTRSCAAQLPLSSAQHPCPALSFLSCTHTYLLATVAQVLQDGRHFLGEVRTQLIKHVPVDDQDPCHRLCPGIHYNGGLCMHTRSGHARRVLPFVMSHVALLSRGLAVLRAALLSHGCGSLLSHGCGSLLSWLLHCLHDQCSFVMATSKPWWRTSDLKGRSVFAGVMSVLRLFMRTQGIWRQLVAVHRLHELACKTVCPDGAQGHHLCVCPLSLTAHQGVTEEIRRTASNT